MAEHSAKDLIAALPRAFDPAKANGISADVQLHLTGNQGGDWVIGVRNGACTVMAGTASNPTLSLDADAQDFVSLVTGRLNPMQALMMGRLKVQGDMGLAARFPSMFKAS